MIADRNRDRDIDADHADIDAGCKLARSMTVTGEDCDTIAILVFAGQAQRFLKVVGAHDLQNGSEDLFLIAFHLRGYMVNQRRPDEEAFFVALQCKAATIDDNLAAFFFRCIDPAFDPRLVLRRDNRAIMRVGIVGDANVQRGNRGEQLLFQPFCRVLAYRNNHRQRHAAFAGRAKGGTRQIVDHLVQISIGHHNAVVLRAAHRLNAFASSNAAPVNIMRDVRASDKADR